MRRGFLRRAGAACSVALFAIDEAHCISRVGARLPARVPRAASVCASCSRTCPSAPSPRPRPPGAATTSSPSSACATRRSFRASFNRPNLFYDVRPEARQPIGQLLALSARQAARLRHHLLPVARRRPTTLAAKLTADGFRARPPTTPGSSGDERQRRQDAFMHGRGAHHRRHDRLRHGDRQAGRALRGPLRPAEEPRGLLPGERPGRTRRLPSDCILFYSYADAADQRSSSTRSRHRASGRSRTPSYARWPTGRRVATCRRKALLAYFDEAYEGELERCCDVCSGRCGRNGRLHHPGAAVDVMRQTDRRALRQLPT